MISKKIASLEERLARLEAKLINKFDYLEPIEKSNYRKHKSINKSLYLEPIEKFDYVEPIEKSNYKKHKSINKSLYLEPILKKSSFKSMVEMIDPRTKRVEAVDTLDSFYENNMDDEEVIEALDELKSGLKSEVLVPTGQGYYILKLK